MILVLFITRKFRECDCKMSNAISETFSGGSRIITRPQGVGSQLSGQGVMKAMPLPGGRGGQATLS